MALDRTGDCVAVRGEFCVGGGAAMTASSSLNASANTLESIGRVELARQCRLWAVAAEALGELGERLYRGTAADLARFTTVKAFEHSSSRDGSAAEKAAPGNSNE
jgi:hypothetical protein